MANAVTIQKNICKGCSLCVDVCPKQVLGISRTDINERGYNPAIVLDISSCIACGMCGIICPDSAITVEKEDAK